MRVKKRVELLTTPKVGSLQPRAWLVFELPIIWREIVIGVGLFERSVYRHLSRGTISRSEERTEQEIGGRKLEQRVDKQSAFESTAMGHAQPTLGCSECTASTGSLVEI